MGKTTMFSPRLLVEAGKAACRGERATLVVLAAGLARQQLEGGLICFLLWYSVLRSKVCSWADNGRLPCLKAPQFSVGLLQ